MLYMLGVSAVPGASDSSKVTPELLTRTPEGNNARD